MNSDFFLRPRWPRSGRPSRRPGRGRRACACRPCRPI